MPASSGGANTPVYTGPSPTEVNANDLASVYLGALGAPNTTENRRALAAWFLAESAHGSTPGSIVVIGNNPLNLTGSGSGGSRSYAGHSFAVYNSPAEGAAAWASTLKSAWGQKYGYNVIAASFIGNSTNGQATIDAIKNSGWVTGRLGQSYTSGSLQNAFNHLTGAGSNEPNIFNIPNGTILTDSTIGAAMAYFMKYHSDLLGSDPVSAAIAQQQILANLQAHKGETWNAATAAAIQGTFYKSANQANPLNTYLAPLQSIGTLAGDLTDPQKWGYTLALLGGVGLIVIGGLIITKGALFPSATPQRAAAPVIVTGGR